MHIDFYSVAIVPMFFFTTLHKHRSYQEKLNPRHAKKKQPVTSINGSRPHTRNMLASTDSATNDELVKSVEHWNILDAELMELAEKQKVLRKDKRRIE